jgi:predicted phosphodiesterase
MRVAILADVHANRAALVAVLAEARRRGAERLVCLGDVVGYHAEPNECVELLAAWPCDAVLGNHDVGALGAGDPQAGSVAAAVQRWTASVLTPASRAWLGAWPLRLELPWAVVVHGTFTHPRHVVGYVTPTTAAMNLDRLAAAGADLGLFGHTHVPVVWGPGGVALDVEPGRLVRLPPGPALVNPGSVGQPRDGDVRAAFAIYDLDSRMYEQVRVAYDRQITIARVRAAGLDASMITRLEEGR